jgi:hypothetical protein
VCRKAPWAAFFSGRKDSSRRGVHTGSFIADEVREVVLLEEQPEGLWRARERFPLRK